MVEIGPGDTGITIGSDVYALTALPGELAPKPRSLVYVQAAAVPLTALTAWQAFFDHAGLAAGQTVFIHGTAGGVGIFAIQRARWAGAHVIGTASALNSIPCTKPPAMPASFYLKHPANAGISTWIGRCLSRRSIE